jgi:type IV secretory pathway TraG/TraD family ATPase VirD4
MELGRSKGVGIFLGCQDINQIKTLYQESAQTILNLCSTTVCFRPNSVETAKYYESFFGKREVSLVQESHSLGPGKGKDSVQITRRNHVEELLLASELQQLPNMKAYIKIQHHDPALITIPKRFFEDKQESFIMAPWLKLENQRHLPVEPKKKPAQEKSHLEF